MPAVAGVDVGGTFTDIFVHDTKRNRTAIRKVPSTPPTYIEGFMSGVEGTVRQIGANSLSEVSRLVHGSTIATNSILTETGAKLGFLMTEGFRDVLYIGLGWRPQMYDLYHDDVEPMFLAPRERTLTVRERVDFRGEVVIPLDDHESVRQAARTLVEQHGVEAFVVCYLHSYANSDHEHATRDILKLLYPDLPVSLSSDVLPRPREYQRLVATGFDAYVKPVMTKYVNDLAARLAQAGCRAPLHVMQSNGGVGGVDSIVECPIRTVLSGLAAGVLGAADVGLAAGFPNCISLDMGGTSADVALIPNGTPVITNKGGFEDWPLHLPMVEVRSIGAGGSSIAYIDDGGGLRVGPRSAGASPGPACYGRGGIEPTVTDASFILGYLNPDTFAGDFDLDLSKSHAVVKEHVSDPLGMDVIEAALGIHKIVNSNMAQTLRLVSIKRGYDPRDFTFIAAGGAGPVHGGRLAEELEIGQTLIPQYPGVLAAMGLMLAPVQHDALGPYHSPASTADLGDIEVLFRQLDAQCAQRMRNDDVAPETCRIEYFAEMRYVGQSHDLEVPIAHPLGPQTLTATVAEFHAEHQRLYMNSNPANEVEFSMLRSVHSWNFESTLVGSSASTAGGKNPTPQFREAVFSMQSEYQKTPVYDRAQLPKGFELTGPAIIEQSDTTSVIYPGHRMRVDEIGNLIVTVPTDSRDAS
jgi:N-methylhydantoinase A